MQGCALSLAFIMRHKATRKYLIVFVHLFTSQVNWDEHCMNVSNAMQHVMKACQCDSKAVTPDQLQVRLVCLVACGFGR